MKYFLVFYICSQIAGGCDAPMQLTERFETWNQCVKAGGELIISFTENMKDSIEDNRLYLTYSCGTVPTTTLKYEHPSITPWSRW
mgnify:FL=1